MNRVLPYCLVMLCAITAHAEELNDGETARGSGRQGDKLGLAQLDLLSDIPLPGESKIKPNLKPLNIKKLGGKTVTKVTAIDPPQGFYPVDDARIPLGISLDLELIRKAAIRLWETGKYRNILISASELPGGNVELGIKVKPIFRLAKFELTGVKALDEGEVKRSLKYIRGSTIVLDQSTLEELSLQLEKAYEKQGYPSAHAKLKIETTQKPGEVSLVVQVNEGDPARYTKIRVKGLGEVLDSDYILQKIKIKQGIIRNKEKIRTFMGKIGKVLLNAGYPDARVGEAVERKLGEYSYSLEIPVSLGLMTEFSFRGNRRIRESALRKKLTDSRALRSTPEAVQTALIRLKKLYRKNGLFHARITAARICNDEKGGSTLMSTFNKCGSDTVSQEIVFKLNEGPPVEVVSFQFNGNDYFSDEVLDAELFAFMAEKNKQDNNFMPFNSRTFDALGTSDKHSTGAKRSRGSITPTTEPSRIYVPEQYYDAMAHLTAMYQERGFLEAVVVDTCDLAALKGGKKAGVNYRPLRITRETDDDDDDDNQRDPCVLIGDNFTSLRLTITVTEGPQTKLERVRVSGNNPSVFTEAMLLSKADIRSGQPYNEYEIREASLIMKDLYRASGYIFGDVAWKSSISQNNKLADVMFTVEEGPLVHVRRIIVQGNEDTADGLIRDRITLKKGDLITPKALSKSEQRLMQIGIFDAVSVQMQMPEEPSDEKIVVVKVSESKPQYLELRGGIATVEGPRGLIEYGYKNIGGRAITIRGRARGNYRLFFAGSGLDSFEERYNDMSVMDRLEHHLLVGVGTQHLPGTGGLLGAFFDVVRERTNEAAFSVTKRSLILRVESDRYRVFRAEIHSGVEWTDIELPEGVTALQGIPQFQRWARMPEGNSTFWVSGFTLTIDLRDDYFNPTKGIFVNLGGDVVRSFASDQTQKIYDPDTGELLQTIDKFSYFIRSQLSISGYIPLIGKKLVLALSGSFGYIFHLAEHSTTWADRYFYIGGIPTLRGFAQDTLVPDDVYSQWKGQLSQYGDDVDALLESYGGESMFILRGELRYPITGPLSGTLFAEAGNVWRETKNTTLNSLRLRPVSGVGLRLATPVGPISFDIGINLDKRPYEDRTSWFFSIGSAF